MYELITVGAQNEIAFEVRLPGAHEILTAILPRIENPSPSLALSAKRIENEKNVQQKKREKN